MPSSEPEGHRQGRFSRPPGATELLIVRHGESAPYVPGRPFPLMDGHGDPALAAAGLEQAQRVADRLADAQVGALYVTTLQRTHQTAAPLAARLGLEPTVEADLREVHLGEWEGGLFRQRVAEGHPAAVLMREQERWDVVPGAEPEAEFRARVVRGVNRVAASHPDQRVVVVAHGGVIAKVLEVATGCRPFAFAGADNGSITHLVVDGPRWVVRRFNDTGHLDGDLGLEPEPLT